MSILISIGAFLIALGLMVFFHEMGHFIAAKACGVYCDRFSLGMPPRVWGIKIGETDYCIGALPLGGYVKMAGQEDAPLSEEERESTYGKVPPHRWFNNKPVWQRVIIIAAGPFMNIVLGILLYAIVAGVGHWAPKAEFENRIGYILENSPAARAPLFEIGANGPAPGARGEPDTVGWRTGDRIVEIEGKPVTAIHPDVWLAGMLSKGDPLDVIIEREGPDGALRRYYSPATPEKFGEGQEAEFPRFGIAPFRSALVSEIHEGHPAAQAGIKKGDIIHRLNGEIVELATFVEKLEKMTEGASVTLEILRGDETLNITVTPEVVGRFRGISFAPIPDTPKQTDGEPSKPVVIAAVSTEVESKTGLKREDIIVEVNGEPATMDRIEQIQRERAGETAELTIKRPAVMWGLLRPGEIKKVALEITPVGAIGVSLGTEMVFHREPLSGVLPAAWHETVSALDTTWQVLAGLLTGHVKPNNLGGPVAIFTLTADAAKAGWVRFLWVTAFISINLCFFNLLPLPVLDGGQLVFLAVEGVRRKAVSVTVQERVQQIGLIMILCLVLYVTFNDVQRLITRAVP